MFCPLDDKGVTNIPKPKPGWIWDSADGPGFKLFCEQVVDTGTNRGTHGCTMDLFIILTLEEEISIFQAEFQQFSDVLYGHRGSVV